MRRIAKLLMIAALAGAIGSCAGIGAETVRVFGFGGSMTVAFFPDLSGVNAFLSENDLDPFGDYLIGGGGSGRGGVIGGPVAGGIGWGVVAVSEKEDRYAGLVFGGGGFDLGIAIGGDERSVLTVGAILGGGAMVLDLGVQEAEGSCFSPTGIVPEPIQWTMGRAIGFVQPYVSLQAQLLSWVGLELRIGYILPVFGVPFSDLVGIPAPVLDLSGPMVSLGFAFGGIADTSPGGVRMDDAIPALGGSIVLSDGADLRIENELGDVVITSYPIDVTQTGSLRVVEWTAIRRGGPRQLAGLDVQVDDTPSGVALRSTGTGRIDYEIRVPKGTSLEVRNGMGDVVLSSHEAESVVIENGIGEIELHQVKAVALVVAGGIGSIKLVDVDAVALTVHLGIGEITLDHRVGVPATVAARTGLGGVSYGTFPESSSSIQGRIGKSGKLVLGGGGPVFDLSVGLGEIEVRPLQP